MITLDSVSKSFGDVLVLDNVSAAFNPGKVNIIIGGSGSGKSVLMKCMVGLFPIDSGRILYNDVDFSQLDNKEKKPFRKEIGMLFQNSALFDSMTVEQNVLFPLNMFSREPRSVKLERVNYCLKRVGLEGANKKYPSEISGGMKKRVGIARAIVLEPKYLFCDEPNSGLDPLTSIKIDDLILEITQEFDITTVVNTHDMNSVMQIGDSIIFIYKGKKYWEGNKDSIFKSDNKVLNEFVFASEFLKNARNG